MKDNNKIKVNYNNDNKANNRMLTPRESLAINNQTLMNDINNIRQSFNDLKRSLEQNKLLKE